MKKEFFAQKYFSFSFVAAMAMVAVEVSLWVSAFCILMLAWKWGAEKQSWPRLSRRWTSILSILFLGQILFQYRTLIGQEPAYTFLLALSALRVMDYENERDHKFLILLGFVLIAVKALFSVDVYWILPSGLAFWGLWYSLMPESLQQRSRLLNRIFLLSLPLAAVLFVVFPRFVLPWAMSRGSSYGQIGFSDDLNPGRVADIASSESLAFRAKIDQLPVKEIRDLYWRGAVLSISKGLSWRPVRNRAPIATRNQSSELAYDVALEPTMQNFLFTLDGTTRVMSEGGGAVAVVGQVFRSLRPLQATTIYRGLWSSEFKDQQPPGAQELELPELTGRVQEWVQETLRKRKSMDEKLESLRTFFAQGGFRYTLKPGVYTGNDLEDFLFKRKLGFCEHFAGAYGTLARALGIPARIVAGYQGGVYNPLGNFWKVSQKDAHAWVEIFNNGSWQRVDPTAWVAPLRLMIGGEEFFSLSDADQAAFAQTTQWQKPERSFDLFVQIRFLVDNINYRWNYFLLDFDRSSQLSLFSELSQHRVTLFFMGLVTLVLVILLWRSLYRIKMPLRIEQKILTQVETWGRKQNQERDPAETPLRYFARLAEASKEARVLLQRIYKYYDLKVYANREIENGDDLLKEWRDFASRA